MTYLPILLDRRFSASSLAIGMVMFVSSFSTALISARAGAISEFLSGKRILMVGFMFFGVAMAVVPHMRELWMFVVPTALLGVGLGMFIPCIQSILVEMAPVRHRAAFLSVNSLLLRLGQTLGPLIMSAVILTGGIGGVFYMGAALSAAMIVVAAFMIDT